MKTYKSNHYASRVKVTGELELVYSPDKPLNCGAVAWCETRGDVTLTMPDGSTINL